MKSFRDIFTQATGIEKGPFRFQERFAEELPSLVRVPTGAGKTAMAVLGWVWRRRFADDVTRNDTPRRLIYCLPMRVLVEQTRDNTNCWLEKLGLHAGDSRIAVSVLMGGEERDEWDVHPERETIVIGTQDMLLSRALNRGYGMTRFRWPMHFGLLNNDALWVFDEIQLMGSGLATTSQLEAFRNGFRTSGPTRSIWMSATLEPKWLKTVDYAPPATVLELADADTAGSEDLSARMNADKPLRRAATPMGDAGRMAKEVLGAHQPVPGSRTIVVLNTVDRAIELFESLQKAKKKERREATEIVLLHSRFRPAERAGRIKEALAKPGDGGTIVVSTQVIEAGVDVSARTMFTDLAPWASLVQRFGRCNRRGTDTDAQVYWIDYPADAAGEGGEKKRQTLSLPYSPEDLAEARELLQKCENVGPNLLPKVELRHKQPHVIRRKDFVELFDTTPDLAGNDIDVSRYVRETEDLDVQVFWRDLNGADPETDEPFPRREELCSVRIGRFRAFLEKVKKKPPVARWRPYRRNFLERKWEVATDDAIFPGQVLMLDSAVGGYEPLLGWTGEPGRVPVLPPPPPEEPETDSAMDDDPLSQAHKWQSIADHTDLVCRELEAILGTINVPQSPALRLAARWHDRGKAHDVFQDAVRTQHPTQGERPAKWKDRRDIGKAPGRNKKTKDPGWWVNYRRKHFRHELASALAVLHPSSEMPGSLRDLVAYLIASHHGKVRLSIRSMPDELRPSSGQLFARGVWHNDPLTETDLGDGTTARAVALVLDPMGLGLCEDEQSPFFGQPSWAERMLALRDHPDLGPFRLALLESLLRAADERASASKPQRPNAAEDANA